MMTLEQEERLRRKGKEINSRLAKIVEKGSDQEWEAVHAMWYRFARSYIAGHKEAFRFLQKC